MTSTLFLNTVTPLLLSTLTDLMAAKEFKKFRLVGGTSLSLQLGHRKSVDIDLFTDANYGTIDFTAIDRFLTKNYPYTDSYASDIIGLGKSYYIGQSMNDCIKLDLYYTDSFIRPYLEIENIRFATIEEIIAMKVDVISRIGRKKDFWDLHELLENYSIEQMLELHKERYPYTHNRKEILLTFINFDKADDDFNPICLRQKYWEAIKLDINDKIKGLV